MKKIGIIGGVGWPSTIEYYRIICEESQRYHSGKVFSGPIPMPEIHIESLNMNFSMNNQGSSEPGSWKIWDEYFNKAIKTLEKNGAEVISIASVTPHTRLNEISSGINTRIVSVYEALGVYCNNVGIRKLLVLGTMPTMTSPAFISSMDPFDVSAIYPQDDVLKNKVVSIINDLYQNNTTGAGARIDQIVRQCVPEHEIHDVAVCLACTELPLAFQDFSGESHFETMGIKYINSTVVHAQSIFASCVD